MAGKDGQLAFRDLTSEEKNRVLLRPHLDAGFLRTLVWATKTCGWSVDLVETSDFVEWCQSLVGAPGTGVGVDEPFSDEDGEFLPDSIEEPWAALAATNPQRSGS